MMCALGFCVDVMLFVVGVVFILHDAIAMTQQKPQSRSLSSSNSSMQLLPRVIRAKDAPAYLGMSRDVFTTLVKPDVLSFPIGKQGVGFDRLDLDNWLMQYKDCNGCSAKQNLGEDLWLNDNIDDQVSIGVIGDNSGLSIRSGRSNAFTASLTRITQMKPKRC